MTPRIRTLQDVKDLARLQERFWSTIDPDVMPHECHRWEGGRNVDGYGLLSITHRDGTDNMYRAHHVAWLLAHGVMPPADQVMRHECDTPHCVNLLHLDLGSQGDNMRDRDRRGRQAPRQGEANGRSLLTAEDVLAIRAPEDRRGLVTELARHYGVDYMSIKKIRDRRTWTHL